MEGRPFRLEDGMRRIFCWMPIWWSLAISCTAGNGTDAGTWDTPETAPVDLPSSGPCTVLFGLPNERTGLDGTRCQPFCDCEGRRFEPPTYDEAWIATLEARVLETPLDAPLEDPYQHPERHRADPTKVCGVLPGRTSSVGYRLETFDDAVQAKAAGATITHQGACGLCSTLKDLAVYMRYPDLTYPVRECGMRGIIEGDDALIECLMALGFTDPCARIWAFNTIHTRKKCQSICLALWDAPYHDPETGALNACLQCDEDESGEVFRAVAGRTRRNTGLPSSMCRPCQEVVPIVHSYP